MRHCEHCIYLSYHEGNPYEGEGESGFICEKRVYKTNQEEIRHLSLLEAKEYRLRSKKCCELEKEFQDEVTN